jgi:hypothetical protein
MSEQNFAQFKAALIKLGADLDESAERIISQMADIGLATTKKNTPVGKYSAGSGKIGGTLRRGWMKDKSLKVGCNWQSGYSNNVEYGMYVNNGHRIVGKGGTTIGYVKGKRMLEQGINEARRQNETLMRNEIERVKQKDGW